MRLVDTHCHLAFEAFDDDLEAVLERARAAGVQRCVVVAVDGPSARRAIGLSEATGGYAVPTAGIHPNEEAVTEPDAFAQIAELARSGAVCAVGETGLDTYRDNAPLAAQLVSLERHVALALETGLPLVLHCRDAFAELRAALGRFAGSPLRGVLHCFTGAAGDVDWLLAAGLHIGVGGIATFKSSGALRAALARVPDERLLLETDAPFLAPVPCRGHRNEPSFVAHVARFLAAERGCAPEELAERTTANAERLFGLDLGSSSAP